MTSTSTRAGRGRTRAALAITVGVLAVLVIGFFIFAGLYADVLWYDQLNFLEVLTTQWAATARHVRGRIRRDGARRSG